MYTGLGDGCQCVWSAVMDLVSWILGDDAFSEHYRHLKKTVNS